MSTQSKVIILNERKEGTPTPDIFKFIDRTLSPLQDRQVLLQTLYLSVDPYLLGRITAKSTYVTPFELKKPIFGDGAAQVVDSKSSKFKKGDIVCGLLEWADFSIVTEDAISIIPEGVDIEAALSVCGMVGLTAFFGLEKIAAPKQGEVALVSGASGAVGLVVCQLLKLKGCRVIGVAGGAKKVQFLKELGVEPIDYKSQDVNEEVKKMCPDGIDIYWDNVGGKTLDAAIFNMKNFGRSVECGTISQYTETDVPKGVRLESLILSKRIKMQGMIVFDWKDEFDRATKELVQYYKDGKLQKKVCVAEGLNEVPNAFIGLFQGSNIGKQLVKIC